MVQPSWAPSPEGEDLGTFSFGTSRGTSPGPMYQPTQACILCFRPEIPMAGRLTYFSWEEVIQANCLVLEIIHQGYTIELLQTPQFKGVMSTPSPPAGPHVLADEVEDLLRKRAVMPVRLDQERSGFYSTYFLVPKQDGGHRPILNLKYFNFSVRKTSFKMETLKSMTTIYAHISGWPMWTSRMPTSM